MYILHPPTYPGIVKKGNRQLNPTGGLSYNKGREAKKKHHLRKIKDIAIYTKTIMLYNKSKEI